MEYLKRDGVALAYEDAGQGRPPIMLIHGHTCDHTFLAPQFEHFRQDHRVVAVDLRGHGQSDKPEGPYTISTFADDVAWLCSELGLHRPVLVGHGLGGTIALDLNARYPDVASAIVLLDTLVLPPTPVLGMLPSFVQALLGPGARDVIRGFYSAFFAPTDNAIQKERILDKLATAEPRVVAAAFDAVYTYDFVTSAAVCRLPLLYVDGGAPNDRQRFRELCPQVVTGQVVGAAHFLPLLVPDQMNAMIDRFLEMAVPGELTALHHGTAGVGIQSATAVLGTYGDASRRAPGTV
jgi:pimeloyl-ACP methyl ester carboxylesterase